MVFIKNKILTVGKEWFSSSIRFILIAITWYIKVLLILIEAASYSEMLSKYPLLLSKLRSLYPIRLAVSYNIAVCTFLKVCEGKHNMIVPPSVGLNCNHEKMKNDRNTEEVSFFPECAPKKVRVNCVK